MTWWSIRDNNWGIENPEQLRDYFQWLHDDLANQLGNYNNDTLEWSQSITAINDRLGNYKQAINQYNKLIGNIKWSAAEAKRWSAIKQQAKQWYITWLSTKRGNTHAEALKDMADIEATGNAERASIRGQEMSNLWEAQGWLANLHMTIAEQEAALADSAANRASTSSSSTPVSDMLNNQWNMSDEEYANAIAAYNDSLDMVNGMKPDNFASSETPWFAAIMWARASNIFKPIK